MVWGAMKSLKLCTKTVNYLQRTALRAKVSVYQTNCYSILPVEFMSRNRYVDY